MILRAPADGRGAEGPAPRACADGGAARVSAPRRSSASRSFPRRRSSISRRAFIFSRASWDLLRASSSPYPLSRRSRWIFSISCLETPCLRRLSTRLRLSLADGVMCCPCLSNVARPDPPGNLFVRALHAPPASRSASVRASDALPENAHSDSAHAARSAEDRPG